MKTEAFRRSRFLLPSANVGMLPPKKKKNQKTHCHLSSLSSSAILFRLPFVNACDARFSATVLFFFDSSLG
jgi:hypothetical protein